jgi:hypothetical protein
VSLEKFNELSTEIAALKANRRAPRGRRADRAGHCKDGKCAGVVADVWRDVGKPTSPSCAR